MILYILGGVLVWLWVAGAFTTITLSWEGDETPAFLVFLSIAWPLLASIGMLLSIRDRIRR